MADWESTDRLPAPFNIFALPAYVARLLGVTVLADKLVKGVKWCWHGMIKGLRWASGCFVPGGLKIGYVSRPRELTAPHW